LFVVHTRYRVLSNLSNYFKNIAEGINTTLTGMRLTFRHLVNARKQFKPGDVRKDDYFSNHDGRVTIQYPLEAIPIPDNGRYRLHNEMDDCIVCDKCAKVCPVDCIDIEPIKATEEVGKASDGSPIRLYAARFDIDMAKCCYCGLCTTVCPTECLTMTKTFDYSELDVRDMIYHYANLSPEEAKEKQDLLEQFQKEKEAQKLAAKVAVVSPAETAEKPAARPVFKPGMKSKPPVEVSEEVAPTAEAKPKPVFRPGMKPKAPAEPDSMPANTEEKPEAKAPFRPTMKPKTTTPSDSEGESTVGTEQSAAKPAFRPTMKPKTDAAPSEVSEPGEAVPAKPAFRPTMKPKATAPSEAEPTGSAAEESEAKPAFRPTMKPKTSSAESQAKPDETANPDAVPKVKPAFRPTMKPKPKEGEE
jgi:formate hydrogenlyase subunit 6/NADH:ubiquinone oxidoreductase subunit I